MALPEELWAVAAVQQGSRMHPTVGRMYVRETLNEKMANIRKRAEKAGDDVQHVGLDGRLALCGDESGALVEWRVSSKWLLEDVVHLAADRRTR